MDRRKRTPPLDALYGALILPEEIVDLQYRPIIQRLRHVRLSNIDSLDLPGIANISRYEHSLGASFLASRMPLLRRLGRLDALTIQAAALMHDWAITPFGHLVEEAAAFVGQDLTHEAKMAQQADPTRMDLGGVDLQLLHGAESGLSTWLQTTFGDEWAVARTKLTDLIEGKGQFGRCIAGTVDLDNLDNVTRIAFHMGLETRKSVSVDVAGGIVNTTPLGEIVFARSVLPSLEEWVNLRKAVYERLMLSPLDFAGKIMLTAATYIAFERGALKPILEWKKTDADFISSLLGSEVQESIQAVQRWMIGDVWECSDLWWIEGEAPPFPNIKSTSEEIGRILERSLYGYRIKDKRNRLHRIHLDDGTMHVMGTTPSRWLLGFAGPSRKSFTAGENKQIVRIVTERFGGSMMPAYETPDLFDLG